MLTCWRGFSLKSVDFRLKNADFLLKNVDFTMKITQAYKQLGAWIRKTFSTPLKQQTDVVLTSVKMMIFA